MANFSIMAKLGMDGGPFRRGLTAVWDKTKQIGKQIGGAIKAGFAIAAAAAVAFAIKSVSAFVDFEKKITEVATLLPNQTEKGFGKMQKDMRELAQTMGVDLIDATQALYNAISAGIPEGNAVSFLKDATKLSIAGVTELSTAVSGLTTVLDAYNMESSEASKISDILFATVQSGKTTIGELAANVGKVTPLASELGVTFQEVGAMFAVLTKKLGDGKTAEAATQIKAMLAELGKEGSKAADAFEKLAGKSFTQFLANGGNVTEAMQLMAKGAEESGTGLQNMFGSIEAGMGALAIAAENGNQLAGALENIKNGTGGTDKAFAKMEKTTGRQFAKMKSHLHEIMIRIGDAFLPFINKILPLFIGLMKTLPEIIGATAGSAGFLAAAFDLIGFALKIAIKMIASIVNAWGTFADIMVLVGKQIGVFVATFVMMGKTAFSPIIAVVAGVVEAFKALGDILADPFDADNYEKAFKRIQKANEGISKSVANWGDVFQKTFEKNGKHFKKNNKEFIENMQGRSKLLKDIWEEEGNFAFLNLEKAEGAAEDLQDDLAGAANQAGRMNGNLGAMAFNIRMAGRAITRDLVKALARGNDAATPLGKMMADIQAASEKIATFWANAAGDFAKIAGGKIELKIQGFKGQKEVEGFVRNMTELEKKLRGGAGRIAALAPEAMAKVMEAFEKSGRKDAAVLSTMYENAQRAQDMTVEGLSKLDDEIQAITTAAAQSDVAIKDMNKSTRMYVEWLKTRRDIAEENLEIQLQQMAGAKALNDQMDELGSLLGTISDLEGKKDAKSMELLRIHKEELLRVTGQLDDAIEQVGEEAAKIGVDPAQVEAIERAKEFLEEANAKKLSETEWLEKIHGTLEHIDQRLVDFQELLPNIKPEKLGDLTTQFAKLNQQETQGEVLETLSGFFVNQ